MNILLATIFEYPHTGGLSTHMQTLKAGLEHWGHRVDTLSFSDLPLVTRKYFVQAPSFLLNQRRQGSGFVWSQRRRMAYLRTLIKQVKNRYDVVGAQDVYAALAAIQNNCPTVLTVHGYMAREAVSKGTVLPDSPEMAELEETEKAAYTQAKRVVTVDRRIHDYIQELTGVDPIAIHNFIDTEAFKPNKANKVAYRKDLGLPETAEILFVPRRLTEKNGVIYPALAMPQLLKRHPEALLIYAGDGEEKGYLQNIIAQRQLQKHIRLLGAVPHAHMQKYYAASDVVLIPSVHSAGVEEATSIAALEAMGSKTPVVASAVGGLKEIIDHKKTGLLVQEKNIPDLVEAVDKLLRDRTFSESLADCARQKIEAEFSHIRCAQKYAAIYQSALERPAATF